MGGLVEVGWVGEGARPVFEADVVCAEGVAHVGGVEGVAWGEEAPYERIVETGLGESGCGV